MHAHFFQELQLQSFNVAFLLLNHQIPAFGSFKILSSMLSLCLYRTARVMAAEYSGRNKKGHLSIGFLASGLSRSW